MGQSRLIAHLVIDFKTPFSNRVRVGEMAQQLGAWTALAEHLV